MKGAIVLTLAFVVAVAATIIYPVEFSAAQYFRSDVAVRDAWAPASIHETMPYADPAPWSLWTPSDWFVWDSVRAGHLPLWDRLQGGGYSPVLTFQNGVFHPVRWAMALVPREAAPSVLVLTMLYLILLGTWLLLRVELKFSLLASSAGVAVFVLSSTMLADLHFSGDFLPVVHLPWIALVQHRWARTRSVGDFAILCVLLALCLLAGHPLYVVTVVLAAIGLAIADAVDVRSWGPAVAFSGACGVGVLLDAFAVLPVSLARKDLWFYKTETIQGNIYALFDPIDRWVSAAWMTIVDQYKGQPLDAAQFYLYIGIPALALGFVGSIDALRRRREIVLPLLFGFLAALSLPGPWMLEFSMMRPLKFMNRRYFAAGMVFVLALLVAEGIDLMLSWKRSWRIAAVGLAIAALAIPVWRATFVIKPVRRERLDTGPVLAFLRSDHSVFRITGYVGQTHLPNSSRVTGIEDVRQSTPVFTVRAAKWWRLVDSGKKRFIFPTFKMTDLLTSPLVGDFNVKYAIESRLGVGAFENFASKPPLESRLRLLPVVFASPSAYMRAIPPPVRPRAHFAERVRPVKDLSEAVAVLMADRMLAATTGVVEAAPGTVQGGRGTVAIAYPRDGEVILRSASITGGLLVLHDSYAAGWRAEVDGVIAPIHAVNVLSRGVMVGPGIHVVKMTYVPPGMAAGGLVSAATALLLLLAIAVSGFGRPRRSRRVSAT